MNVPITNRRRAPRYFYLSLLLWLLGSATALFGQATVSKEYQIKAAFLYNFTKFVEWPADHLEAGEPVVIAVLGENPFGPELEKLVAGRLVNGRAIVVRLVSVEADLVSAHIVFVPAGQEGRAMWRHDGLLTVGESAGFMDEGGMIRFTLVDEKVRFEINQTASEQAGLKLSGQLLKLATSVKRGPGEARP